jgi:hypothetical protein
LIALVFEIIVEVINEVINAETARIEWGCVCLFDATERKLKTSTVVTKWQAEVCEGSGSIQTFGEWQKGTSVSFLKHTVCGISGVFSARGCAFAEIPMWKRGHTDDDVFAISSFD